MMASRAGVGGRILRKVLETQKFLCRGGKAWLPTLVIGLDSVPWVVAVVGSVGVEGSADVRAGVGMWPDSDAPRRCTDSCRIARRAAIGPSLVADASINSTEDRRRLRSGPPGEEPEWLRRVSCCWLEAGPGAAVSSGTILSTSRSIICSRRSKRLARGGSDFWPGSGALSSSNSWLRHGVPRCLQPIHKASSGASNWHLIFRLLPIEEC